MHDYLNRYYVYSIKQFLLETTNESAGDGNYVELHYGASWQNLKQFVDTHMLSTIMLTGNFESGWIGHEHIPANVTSRLRYSSFSFTDISI